jgi:uncharacterized membrane protein
VIGQFVLLHNSAVYPQSLPKPVTGEGWRTEDKKMQAISSSHVVKKKQNKSNHAEIYWERLLRKSASFYIFLIFYYFSASLARLLPENASSTTQIIAEQIPLLSVMNPSALPPRRSINRPVAALATVNVCV